MDPGHVMRREWVGVLSSVMLGLTLAFYVGAGISISKRAYKTDFIQFFSSAQSFAAGGSMYRPVRPRDFAPPTAPVTEPSAPYHPNLNPPLLALLFVPLTLLGLPGSYMAWMALSVLSGLFACALLWRGLGQPGRDHVGLIALWLAFLVYFPTYSSLTMGQVTMVTLLPVAGAWGAARTRRDRLAGILVGLAVSLKLFVGLLVVYLVIQRRWRAAAWSIGTILIVAAATLPATGIAAYVEYFSVIRTVTWFGNSWNASYAGVITRVLGGSENVPLIDAPRLARFLVLCCSAVTVAWLAWLTWPRRGIERSLDRFDLGLGLTLVSMLLISPLGWMYYFPILCVPGYAVWSLARRVGRRSLAFGCIVAWGLSTIPTPMVRAPDVNSPVAWVTSGSLYFYALFILGIVTSRALVLVNSMPDGAPDTLAVGPDDLPEPGRDS